MRARVAAPPSCQSTLRNACNDVHIQWCGCCRKEIPYDNIRYFERNPDLPRSGLSVRVNMCSGYGNAVCAGGVTSTRCCGTPVVTPGRDVCAGVRNGACFFTITQDICVTVPVEFGAVATVGDSFVSCNGASDQDICTSCDILPEIPTVPTIPSVV